MSISFAVTTLIIPHNHLFVKPESAISGPHAGKKMEEKSCDSSVLVVYLPVDEQPAQQLPYGEPTVLFTHKDFE